MSVEPDAVEVTWKIVPVNPYRKPLEEGSHVINLNKKKKQKKTNPTEMFKGYLSSKFVAASFFFF